MVQMLGAHKKTPAGTTKNEHPCTFFVCEFAVRTRFRLKPLPSLAVLIRRWFSKAAWMPSVLSNSDVFCFAKKLACKFWHGSQFRTDKDVRGLSSSEFFARKTRRWPVYKEVHWSTGYLQKRWKGGATSSRGLYGLNFNQYVIRKCDR